MSYDYDGLVSEITASRSLVREAESALDSASTTAVATSEERSAKELELLEHLSVSVEKFESLSKHCPMTPLLWMQYALDTFELMNVMKKQEDNPQSSLSNNDNNNNDGLLELVETRIQLLELGLHEFPGSAILRLHHAEMVLVSKRIQQQQQQQQQQQEPQNNGKYRTLLENAIQILGRGSHRNESALVVEFYKLLCDHTLNNPLGKTDENLLAAETLSEIFLQRAETPMNDDMNAGLGEQYVAFAGTLAKASTMATIETLRRFEARHYGFLVTYEDDIDVALQTETGVSIKDGIDNFETATDKAEAEAETKSKSKPDKNGVFCILKKWKYILDEDSSCWMGLGGPQTANAFVQYAQACYRYRAKKEEYQNQNSAEALEERIQNMAVSVFERGIAECPTVDSIWLSYLRRLNYLIDQKTQTGELQERTNLLQKASGVVDRAIRNCPYSTELVKVKLKLALSMANAKMKVLDPEELMNTTIVKECLENGFVQPKGEPCSPSTPVELFQTLLACVRTRILVVLSEMAQTKLTSKKGKKTITTILKHDDLESIQLALSKTPPDGDINSNEELLEELEDSCTDMREIYDEADSYLRKHNKRYRTEHKTGSNTISVEECRAILAKEKVLMESKLLAPLLRAIQIGNDETNGITEEARSTGRARLVEVLQQHETATKIWQPPHPGTYMAYIETLSTSSSVASSTMCVPTDVLRNLRITRFLYQKALKSVGNPRKTNSNKNRSAETDDSNSNSNLISMALSPDELDYETSLRCLCRDYLLFERYFGSDHSYSECRKAVQKKLAKAFTLATNTDGAYRGTLAPPIGLPMSNLAIVETDATAPMALEAENDQSIKASNQKRKRADETEPVDSEKSLPPPSKRQKEDPQNKAPKEVVPQKPTNHRELEEAKGRKFPTHKVKVGKIEHPAHPFTVKVSFLSPQTEDMDLVDALRPKCGAIVHAKIMRDKHSCRSKGWALVQFEERESVEIALGLSDVLGIKNKSVIIERSHLPAVRMVEVHRVNPKGEGKATKRNIRNKNRNFESKGDHQAKNFKPRTAKTYEFKKSAPSKPPTSSASIFAFQPRVVAGGSQQRKTKISVSTETKKGDTEK